MKISFCVPCYNRRQELTELFSSILEFSRLATDLEVELCFSDNHSTDGSYEYSCELFESIDSVFFKHHQHKHNAGFQKNLLSCLKMATGDLVWLLGSDDSIVPNKLLDYLTHINNYKLSAEIFLINRNICDNKLNYEHQDTISTEVNNCTVLLHTHNGSVRWLKKAVTPNALGCFISSIGFSKKFTDIFIQTADNYPEYYHNIFPHVAVIWKIIASNKPVRMFYCNECIVNWRGANSSFSAGEIIKCDDLLRVAKNNLLPQEVSIEFEKLVVRHYKKSISFRNLLEFNMCNDNNISARVGTSILTSNKIFLTQVLNLPYYIQWQISLALNALESTKKLLAKCLQKLRKLFLAVNRPNRLLP